MKNIQLGYTLPKGLTQKFYVENLRVYFSAENLLTITGYEGLDPEKPAGSGDLYPTTKTYTVGLNLLSKWVIQNKTTMNKKILNFHLSSWQRSL